MQLKKRLWIALLGLCCAVVLLTTGGQAAAISPYNAVGGVFNTDVYSSANTIVNTQQLPQKIIAPKGFDAKKVYRLTQKTTLTTAESKWLYNRTYVVPYFFYRYTKADTSQRVNVNHLTTSQQLELAQYTAKLINQFRRTLGLNSLQITQNSEAMTLKYLQYRRAHHVKVHPTVAQQNSIWYSLAVKYAGLSSSQAGRQAFLLGNYAMGENVAFDYRAYRADQQKLPTTMLGLKVSIYNGIAMMLLCDNVYNEQWGHFINFTTARLHTFGFVVQAGVKWPKSDARSGVDYVWLLSETTNDGSKKITNEAAVTTQVASKTTAAKHKSKKKTKKRASSKKTKKHAKTKKNKKHKKTKHAKSKKKVTKHKTKKHSKTTHKHKKK